MLKRLFKESLIYGLSRYIGKFIGVFLLPLYTAVLSPEDYGILDLLGTIITVSTFLIVSGTDSALSYYYYRKEHFEHRGVMISSSLWLRIFFSASVFIIIFIVSPHLSFIMFGRDYTLFVQITGISIIFQSVQSFLFDLLRFEFRPWFYTIVSTLGILLQIVLTIIYVLVWKQGVYGALIASTIAYGILFLTTIIYVFKRYGIKFSTVWIGKIFKYGFPLIGTGIAMWILSSTDRYFIDHYVGLSSNGIYAVGMKLASFLGMVAGALQLAWGPFAMDIQYHENAKKIYAKVFFLFFAVNIIGIFVISMFSIDILKVFTQPSFYSAKAVVPFLCFSTVLSSGYFIVAIGINITKKLQHTIWITLGAAVINILLNYFLTPLYGVLGAAFSIMMANLSIFLLTLLISQKYYKVPYTVKQIFIMFGSASLIIYLSYWYNLKLTYRIIISAVYLLITSVYLYQNFKHSYEYKKFIEKIKEKSNFKSKEPQEPTIEI